MNDKKERIILGIDPGTIVMGYGIIKVTGNKMEMVTMGVVHLKEIKDPYSKLQKIFERTSALIDMYLPDELAIEAPFYGSNVQSMLKLGRAQGVAMAACLMRSLPIAEYAPKKIKQSITGNGNATKEQVANYLKAMFKIEKMPALADATDGLAAAVCHYYQKGTVAGKKSYSDWGDFVKKNQDKIV